MSLDIGKTALALLGLLAFQNRDKIGKWIGDATAPAAPGTVPSGGLTGGLHDVLDKFRNSGAADKVDSWIGTGQNQPIDPGHVEKAIDPQVLQQLSEQTGLSREELIERITRDLPAAVDKLSPNGSLPQRGEPDLLDRVPNKAGPW